MTLFQCLFPTGRSSSSVTNRSNTLHSVSVVMWLGSYVFVRSSLTAAAAAANIGPI